MAAETPEETAERVAREHAERQRQAGAQGVQVKGESPKPLFSSLANIGERNLHILETLKPAEPIIIFRAKDILSVMVIVEYQNLIERYGTDTELQAAVQDKLMEFRLWQQANPEHIRLPN